MTGIQLILVTNQDNQDNVQYVTRDAFTRVATQAVVVGSSEDNHDDVQ